jgi:hypothetical protein
MTPPPLLGENPSKGEYHPLAWARTPPKEGNICRSTNAFYTKRDPMKVSFYNMYN